MANKYDSDLKIIKDQVNQFQLQLGNSAKNFQELGPKLMKLGKFSGFGEN